VVHILVIGASRGIGQAVCQAAAAKGFAVRAMSRSGSMPDMVGKNCTVFKGDALNSDDVARSLQGVDVVVQALGVPLSLHLVTKPVTLFSEATRILLPEMKNAGVSKLVSVTGFGAGDSRGSINILQRLPFAILLKRAYDDKSIQEDLVGQSGLDWLIVRPGVLMSCPASGKYRVLTRPDEWRNGVVARADVADFIVKRIEAGELGRERPVIIRFPL
jgi:putative NADH-flavin reductase